MQIALCDDNYIQVKFIEDYLRAQKIDVDYYDSGEALCALTATAASVTTLFFLISRCSPSRI